MSAFKSIEIFEYPRPGDQITEDDLHWKKLGFPFAFKEFGGIDFIDFNSKDETSVAVTCSSKVQLYSVSSNEPLSSFSRFKKSAYGGNFRKDGKLLIAGSEDGFLRLFQVQNNRLLRIFKGHKAATHRCNFTNDGIHLVSFSDDKSVVLWDIPTETKVKTFEEHQDYVRAGTVSQVSQDLFISGSYDHSVKLYDIRTDKSVLSVDHGTPVESVLMFPAGGLFISAGGTSLKVWDPVAGRLLTQVVQHHKTITSLCFASEGRRLLSGSLDRHIKIYDVTSYEVVHTLSYPSPILSIAVSPFEDKVIAAGMADGLFSLRHRKAEKEVATKKSPFSHKPFYGMNFKPTNNDVVISAPVKKIYKRYENHLRKFESSKALDTVLSEYMQKDHPEVTVSIMKELLIRGSLKSAMAGREGDSLKNLMKFVTVYINDIRFQSFLIDVAMMLIDIYGSKMGNPEVKLRFQYLLDAMGNQLECIKNMVEADGIIQAILVSASKNEKIKEVKVSRESNKVPLSQIIKMASSENS